MRDLEAIRTTAQRQLDGMTINRDQMANDVMDLLTLLSAYRSRVVRMGVEIHKYNPNSEFAIDLPKTDPVKGFADIFEETWKGIFGKRS